jgi:hypothetical protein
LHALTVQAPVTLVEALETYIKELDAGKNPNPNANAAAGLLLQQTTSSAKRMDSSTFKFDFDTDTTGDSDSDDEDDAFGSKSPSRHASYQNSPQHPRHQPPQTHAPVQQQQQQHQQQGNFKGPVSCLDLIPFSSYRDVGAHCFV